MTMIHISEEEGDYLQNEEKKLKKKNMLLAYMQCRTVVHVILILK